MGLWSGRQWREPPPPHPVQVPSGPCGPLAKQGPNCALKLAEAQGHRAPPRQTGTAAFCPHWALGPSCTFLPSSSRLPSSSFWASWLSPLRALEKDRPHALCSDRNERATVLKATKSRQDTVETPEPLEPRARNRHFSPLSRALVGWRRECAVGRRGLRSNCLRNSQDECPRKRLLLGLLPHAPLSRAGAA